eukprot:gene6960-17664_t
MCIAALVCANEYEEFWRETFEKLGGCYSRSWGKALLIPCLGAGIGVVHLCMFVSACCWHANAGNCADAERRRGEAAARPEWDAGPEKPA